MDGLSLMNKVNEDGAMIKMPFFIITSAISNENVIQDAFGYGAGYYLLKPFETNMIADRVKGVKSYNKRIPETKKLLVQEKIENILWSVTLKMMLHQLFMMLECLHTLRDISI